MFRFLSVKQRKQLCKNVNKPISYINPFKSKLKDGVSGIYSERLIPGQVISLGKRCMIVDNGEYHFIVDGICVLRKLRIDIDVAINFFKYMIDGNVEVEDKSLKFDLRSASSTANDVLNVLSGK